jgi:ComF family protein
MAIAPQSLVWFLKHVFPAVQQRCAICGACLPVSDQSGSSAVPMGTCTDCQAALKPRTTGFCPRCGLLFARSSEPVSLCLDCRLSPPPWREVFFYGCYDGLLKDLVLRFKFHAQLGLALILREMLLVAMSNRITPRFDLIVPVPLHPQKLRARGFNQSLELACGVASFTSTPMSTQALVRVRNTPAQHTLPRAQRVHNLKGAFLARPEEVRGRSVLLVDDILTTGATARSAAKALRKAKAANVSLLILARA